MISQALRIYESTVVRHFSDYVFLKKSYLKMVVSKSKEIDDYYMPHTRTTNEWYSTIHVSPVIR